MPFRTASSVADIIATHACGCRDDASMLDGDSIFESSPSAARALLSASFSSMRTTAEDFVEPQTLSLDVNVVDSAV
jgi:hypothetical protein